MGVPSSVDDLKNKRFYVALIAELLGTALLVFVGCGSAITWNPAAPPSTTQIALCFGISVATIVWGIANVSGGHINPAVTLAFLVTRKISIVRGILYVIVQLLGAVAGSGLVRAMVNFKSPLGVNSVNPRLTEGQAFGIEFLITFVLVFTVFASCDSKRTDLQGSAPLSIGLSVAMCHLFAIHASGSAMNTARAFGPAVVTGNWANQWVYWAGPILGGAVAGLFYDNLIAPNASAAKTRAFFTTAAYDSDDFEIGQQWTPEPMKGEDKEAPADTNNVENTKDTEMGRV